AYRTHLPLRSALFPYTTLFRSNTEPVEVSISLLFGYPVTDSLGRIVLRTIDHPDSTMRSAAGWIQAFPRRLTVPPLERQTIRLQIGRATSELQSRFDLVCRLLL